MFFLFLLTDISIDRTKSQAASDRVSFICFSIREVNFHRPALPQHPTTSTTPALLQRLTTHQCRGLSFFSAGFVEEMSLKASTQTL
jgi:hypothetical protein